MELRNLITFLKIVETGSFSSAAEQLMYSQSTVTVQIQQLEEELNLSLFERLGKKVFVTEKGREIAEYAKQMLALSEKISSVSTQNNELSGTLTIVSYDSLMTQILPSILMNYHKKYPGVKMSVKPADSAMDVERMLSLNGADCGFIFSETLGKNGFKTAFSQMHPLKFIVAPDHPLANKKNISLEEIFQYDFVVANQYNFFSQFKEQTKFFSRRITPFLDIWNAAALMEVVKLGGCIGIVAHYPLTDAEKKGELCMLDVPELNINSWIQVLYHQNKLVTPQMAAFFDLLNEMYPS